MIDDFFLEEALASIYPQGGHQAYQIRWTKLKVAVL
jgi:hypothetical protein